MNPKRILLVKYRFLGDAILAFPAIAAIRQAYPNAEMDLLTEPVVAELMKGNPWGIRTVVIPESRETRRLTGLLTLAHRFRKARYNLSCNFIHEYTIRDQLLPLLAGIPTRVGFSVRHKGVFFNRRVPIEGDKFISHHGHMTEINAMIPQRVGIPVKNTFPKLWIDANSKSYVRNLLAEQGVGQPLVGIHPCAGNEIHCWPRDHFAAVVKFIIDNYGADVVCTGSVSEMDYCNELAQMVDRRKFCSLAGKTDIHGLIALIAEMKLHISANTGPMHVAAALGIPLISVDGACEPMWSPVGNGTIITLRNDTVKPCYNVNSPDAAAFRKALRDISPDDVISKIRTIEKYLK